MCGDKACGCDKNHFSDLNLLGGRANVQAWASRATSMSPKAFKRWAFMFMLKAYQRYSVERQFNLQRGSRLDKNGKTIHLRDRDSAAYRKYVNAKPRLTYYINNIVDPGKEDEEYQICLTGLVSILQTSKDFLSKVRDMVLSGKEEYIEEVMMAYKDRYDPKAQSIIHYGLSVKEFGDNLPTDDQKIYVDLQSWGAEYENYRQMVEEERLFESDLGLTKAASLTYFKEVFTRVFGEFLKKKSRQNNFSRCSYCGALKAMLLHHKDDAGARAALRTHQYRHYRWVALNRAKYRWHRSKAKMFPDR